MVSLNSFDQLTHADYIYKCFWHHEFWIRHQVNIVNHRLKKQNRPVIKLAYVDVLAPQDLYQQTQQVLITDYWLRDKSKFCGPVFEIPRSVYGIYYMPNRKWHRTIQRDVSCFINENTLIRQLWFYLLYDKNFLDRGYVSFSGQSRSYNLSSWELFDMFHKQGLQEYDSKYQELRNLVPFKNFIETGNLCDTIMSTKFSIVIETWFHRTDVLSFTEKIFRALQTPRPWLLFHSTGSIAALKSLGFYVYDDLIDHSYDSHDTAGDTTQRQQGILKEATKLMDLNVTDSLVDHWEKKTLMNCNILQEYNRNWQKDYQDVLDQAYNKALLLPGE